MPNRLVNGDFLSFKSCIFDMPPAGNYAGYTFAHPLKLSRYERGYRAIRLHDEWVFHLMKVKEPGVLDKEAPVVDLPFLDMLDELAIDEESEYAQPPNYGVLVGDL